MSEQKKDFQKAEIEVIRFEKNDVISTSTTVISGGGQDAVNPPSNDPPIPW